MEIAKLYITLAADADQYKGQLQQVDRETMSWAGDLAGRMSKLVGAAVLAAVAAMGVALGAFFKDSISKAADLEAQMDTVAALLGATAEQAELLRQATIDLALDPNLKVSATEAAQAIEMLAQNGLTVEEILGGAARATVLLANATGADFSTAARIATDAMALWGMEAGDLEQVANGVTAVLVQSKFEVNDYALALAQAGGVASAVGVSFEDFNATLVAIAPFFASGSDAGTSYKTMLQRLIPTTSDAKDAMADLGLITADGANAFFDSEGNMRSMAEVAGLLNGALGGLSEEQRLQALSTIFGTDAMRAAVAMSQFTKEEFERLQAVMANTDAAEIAAQRMQNFTGAMEIFKGVVEGLQLQLGNVLLPILTKLALEGANLLAAWGPPIIEAFQAFFNNLGEGMSVMDAFIEAIDGLVPESVVRALVVFRDSILPVVERVAEAIASFVSWKDVLLALAVVVGGFAASFLLPLLAPIAALAAAVAGLTLVFAAVRTAFETNFLGIRDLALGVWAALQSVFDGIKALLTGDTTAAMAAFRAAWETGWAAVVGFIQNAGAQIGQVLAGLWQSIVTWFQGIDWAALGQSLIERFFAGMAALGQAAAGAWEWVLTSLTSFINTVNWGQLGYTLIDLFIKGIIGAVGLIGTALAGIVTYIWNFITGTNWIELGVNLVTAMVQGLSSFAQGAAAALADWRQVIFDWAGAEDWGDVGEKVAELVGDALGAAKDYVAGKLDEWQTAIFDWVGAEDWEGVAEHIAEEVGEKLGEAKDAVAAQLSEWQTAIFDWADAEDWQGVAKYIADEVGTKLGEAKDAVSAQLSEWQTAIFDWADAEDWEGVAQAVADEVGAKLGEAKDAVAAQLSEWETAVFDWAGVEDWSGVADKVATMVGEALGTAAGSVTSTLDSWEQAIFDWADAEDWVGVSETIAVAVGESLATASDKVTEKLSGWITAFTAWVGTVDWYQVGYDIMFKITDAFLDFKEAINEKISAWLTDTQSATEGYAWYEVGAYILAEIAKAVAGTVADFVTVVGDWISNIGSAISQNIENLKQVGRDLVGGIAAGISAAGDLIRGAIAGVTAAAEPAARQAAQSDSPSRLMMPVGYDLSAGVAVGVTQGAGTIISAIQDVAGQVQLEAVKAFSEAVAAIGEAIESAVRSYVLLSGFGSADTGRTAASLAAITLLMKGMVDAFLEANGHAAEALELVGTFADAAGSVVKLITDSLLPLHILAAIDLGFLSSGRLMAGLSGMRDFLVAAVGAFVEAATELGVLGSLVESFTSAAEGVIGLVEEGLRAVALLAGFNFGAVVQGWHLRDQIVIFRKIAETMVREFAEAALGLAFMSEAVEAFTEAAEGIIGLVEEGLKATALLAGFNFGAAVQGWHLRDQIVIFRKIAETMVREFAEAALGLAFMSEAVEAFTEAAEGVIGLVEEGLRAVVLLAGFNFGAAVQGWHLRDQIVIFRNIVRTMVREFAEAAGEFGSMAESVSAFTEAAEGVIGLVEDGLKAAVALSEIDFGAVVQGWHLRDQIETFRNIIRTLIREFAEAATEFGSMAESVEAFADAADAVLGLVVDGIEAIQALSETDFGALVQGWHLAGQIETFRNIIRTLIREFAEAATEFGSMATSVEAMADAAGAVVDLVGPAIEAIGLLANYEAVAGIRVAATAFSLQLAAVLTAFSEAFAAAANGAEEAMSEAANFAETAGDILDVVAPGIEALGVIATYEAVAGIRVAATAFALQLVAVVMALTDAFEQAGILANEAVIEAGEMSGALEDIVSVVEPAVEAVVALVGYNTVGGLQTNVRQFAADLVVVIQTLVDGLKQAGLLANEAVAEAGEMAKSIADILKVVEPALHPDKGALPLIAKYVSAGGLVQKAQQFTADLIAVTQVLVDGLTTSALAAGVALTKAGEMAKSLKDLFDAVGNGIDAINDIANYTKGANLAQKTGEFTDDLVTVATVIVTGLTAAANKLGAEAVSAAHAFAQSVGLIVSRVRSVVMDLNELGSVATPSIEPKLAYIAASAEQIAKAFSAAGDIGAAVKYAEVFRTNLEQLVQEVKLAVALLAALAGTGTSGPVGAALGAIAAALQNTAGQFAGAGRALAEAFVAMLTVGIAGGAGAAVGATVTVLGAAYNAGMAAAKAFVAVGVAISQAIAAGVLSGQGQVISAVVQVIGAASAAGTAEARKATAVGQELVRSVLAEISGARGALDSAGSAAGVALIDGMVRAITAGKSRLVNAIRESVGAGIAAAKAALGIASPSRVAFELMANFMRTAAIPLSDPRGLVKAIGQSTRAMVAEAARAIGDIGQVQGLVAAPMTAGTVGSGSTMRLTQPALAAVAPQPATPRGLVQPGPVYNFYGNWTVEGVEDGPGLLEQLASIAAGARGR